MNFKKYFENNDCEKINLLPDQRIHTSKHPNLEFDNNKIGQQRITSKPRGLWYSCGRDWIMWCKGENFGLEHLEHTFIIDVDISKLLVLDSVKKIIDFNKKYGDEAEWRKEVKIKLPSVFNSKLKADINWQSVARDYSGIEICPYQWDLRMELDWYYGWDVASGCIWAKDAVKNIQKLSN